MVVPRPGSDAARPGVTARYTPAVKLAFVRRLADSSEDLADLLGIPPDMRQRFLPGQAGRGIWEWLQARDELDRLPAALSALDRSDLARLLDDDYRRETAPTSETSAPVPTTSGRPQADPVDPQIDR